MSSMLLITLALAAAPASDEVLLSTEPGSGTRVYAQVVGDRLHLKSIGPSEVSASYEVDVNNNRVVDARVDRAYGVLSGGTLCPAYQLTASSETTCGGAPTQATVSVEDVGGMRITHLRVPVTEVTRDPNVFRITVRYWNKRTSKSFRQTVTYRLQDVTPAATRQAGAGAQTGQPTRPPASPSPGVRVDAGLVVGRWTAKPGQCATNWIEFRGDKTFKTAGDYEGSWNLTNGTLVAVDVVMQDYVIDAGVTAADRDTLVLGGKTTLYRCK